MADFNCCIRSNYFRVIDEERLKNFIGSMEANCVISLWEMYSDRHEKLFTFGCEGYIWGSNPDEPDFGKDLKKIGELLPDGEVLIVMTVGHEKLRYVSGVAYIVTNNYMTVIDLERLAINKAKKLLRDSDFSTNF